jgi:environmental stress-induced protein Ves
MTVTLLKAENHRRMPWKNGGGVTVEIAVWPENASVDNFDWRVSAATVAEDGAFSVFSDIDRTLSVLEGEGVVLNIDGSNTRLTISSEPLSFAADAKTHAQLISGPITDLNVMTRRGRFSHVVTDIQVKGEYSTQVSTQNLLLFCASGELEVQMQTSPYQLKSFDCLQLSAQQNTHLTVKGNGRLILITLNQ